MQIAHFVQRYPPALGGSEAYFARLSHFLASAGDQVTVFTTTAIDLEAFWSKRGRCVAYGVSREDGVEVIRYQPRGRYPGRRYILKPFSVALPTRWRSLALPCNPICPRMWKDAGSLAGSFDLVHATAFPYAWPIACGLRMARRMRIPFLLTPFLHLGDPTDSRDRTRRGYTSPALLSLARAADCIFVQTATEQDALCGLGIPAEKLVLLGLGVAASECGGGNRAATRHAWGIKPDKLVVGHLANNSREKGTVDLLRAGQRLWERGENFRIVLAGPEMPNFVQFWQAFERKDRVLRLGVLSEKQKRDFYAGLDLFALPSRSDSFGLVLLEAWINGVPNVAYRAGGVADVIRHGEDGLLVPCGNVESLADALMDLLHNGDRRRRLGLAGKERTLRDFQWSDKLSRVRSVYESVVRGE